MWGPYFANHKKHTQKSTSETSRTHSHHPNTIPGRRNKTLFIHINWAGGTVSTQLAKHQGLWQIGYAKCNKNRRFFSTSFSIYINRKVATLLCWPLNADHKTTNDLNHYILTLYFFTSINRSSKCSNYCIETMVCFLSFLSWLYDFTNMIHSLPNSLTTPFQFSSVWILCHFPLFTSYFTQLLLKKPTSSGGRL